MQPSLPKTPFGSRTELKVGAALLAALLLVEVWVVWFNGGIYVLGLMAAGAAVGLVVFGIAIGRASRGVAESSPGEGMPARQPEPTGWLGSLGDAIYWIAMVIAALWSNGFFLVLFKPEHPTAVAIVGPIVIWFLGWAIKYVLGELGRWLTNMVQPAS